MVDAGNVRMGDFFRRLKQAIWPDITVPPPGADVIWLTQAKLFAEVARRVDHPLDVLPGGDPTLVSLALWQRAAAWAIAAVRSSGESTEDGRRAARELLERAAGGSELFRSVETVIGETVEPATADPSIALARAQTLARFVERLTDELERPLELAERRRSARALGIAAVALVVVLLVGLAVRSFRPPNLVPNAAMKLSSQLYECKNAECGSAFFHTANEEKPWVLFDFGKEKRLHSIDVTNRKDCCYDRAVPLVVETSNDEKSWSAQARTEQPFVTWSAVLAGRARFVRLRVDKTSYLHLTSVEIR